MWKFFKAKLGSRLVKSKSAGSVPDVPCRRRPLVLIWIERILLISGLSLLAVYGAARMESFFASRAALKEFAELQVPLDPNHGSSERPAERSADSGSSDVLTSPEVDFTLWGEGRISAYKQSSHRDSQGLLAVLSIPRIGLQAPVLDGTDDLTLNHALGRIAGTARPGDNGNIAIAGHRDGFFRGLRDVVVGDTIELKTRKGTEKYIVDQTKIVKPRQTDVLKPRPVPSLTLVTCYPFYFLGSAPERYIVTASLLPEKHAE
jgi:sortase A